MSKQIDEGKNLIRKLLCLTSINKNIMSIIKIMTLQFPNKLRTQKLRTSLVAKVVKKLPQMQEMWV